MATAPIKIAILAMGGEGGGVLADWIVDLAEHNGFLAQTTSVPGVAQRTGATIYYVELFPAPAAASDAPAPVLALMPLPGDVDIVIASELMEAGRAVQRGLVTPDRTTLVCSTHRVYAIGEKIALGDGRVDAPSLLAHAQSAAGRFVGFDMEQLAEQTGSVISSVLFGALAATGALPFGRALFEATIERGGIGTRASMAGFAAGFEGPRAESKVVAAAPAPASARGKELVERIASRHPASARALLAEGARRLVDYQDFEYATLYLERIETVMAQRPDETLHAELARHLALWMSYEDTIRVADLKTRDTRLMRVRDEMFTGDSQLLAVHEYLHPRLQEICDTLPVRSGKWVLRTGWARRLVGRFASRGRVVQTNSVRGYLLLSTFAGLRRWRRSTLRFSVENARIEAWLREVQQAPGAALALEIVRCQRLIKGYGDTHERGWHNFELIRRAWQRAGREMAPATLRELADAALADEEGKRLREVLGRHALV